MLSEAELIFAKKHFCPSGVRAANKYRTLAQAWRECNFPHYLNVARSMAVVNRPFSSPIVMGFQVGRAGYYEIATDRALFGQNKAICDALRRRWRNPFKMAHYRAKLAAIKKSLRKKPTKGKSK